MNSTCLSRQELFARFDIYPYWQLNTITRLAQVCPQLVVKVFNKVANLPIENPNSSWAFTQPSPAPLQHRETFPLSSSGCPGGTSTNRHRVPHLKEPPPGSFSLFFWAAASCVETVAIALFPGNTAGFTTGTARRKTRFVLRQICISVQIYKPVTVSNGNKSGAKTLCQKFLPAFSLI